MQSLLSVNVGMPKDHCRQGRTVHTGVWKYPQDGPVMVRRLNIDGDGQGDTAGHGGEQRAVLVYQIQSYRFWQEHFGRDDFEYGQFGRISPSTDSPTTRSVSATGTASARPNSKSPSRASPATASACASMNPKCPRCWSATTGRASTCASSEKDTYGRATRWSEP